MNSRPWLTRLMPGLLALATVIATAVPASAVTYNLVAKPFTAAMPGGVTVSMWGFALDTGQLCAETPGWSIGPKLSVPVSDSLTVNLRNCLPVPVSLVIAGQAMPAVSTGSAPVRHTSGLFTGRVRSFTGEAAPNGTAVYSWSTLKPGTYLYHSGTHPQVQVQMGLYGPETKDSGASQAYPAVPYTQQRDLFFSEIDPALHTAVANGTYGTLPGPTSTLDYHPKYFLINGVPFSTGDPCIAGLTVGDGVLLRLYNAGLRELAPMMLGSHFQLVAEGGSRLPFRQERYSVLLQPGSTKDLLFQATRVGRLPIIERRLNLTNNAVPNGGMQTCLTVDGVQPPNVAPSFTAGANQTVTQPAGAQTVPSWATAISAGPANEAGQTVSFLVSNNNNPLFSAQPAVSPTGTLTYTPAAGASGVATLSVQIQDNGGTANGGVDTSPAQTRTITVNAAVGGDLIFQDGFESGNFAAWSGVLDAEADLSVTAGAALVGGFGMAALIDNVTAMHVRDLTPTNEARYRARFYLDPNSIVMASGNTFRIMAALSGNNAGVEVARIEFRRMTNAPGPRYEVRASIRNDATTYINTAWYTIPDASTHIEIDWQAATAVGANNGSLSLWTGGVLRQTLSSIDNDLLRVNSVRLGPLQGIDTGTLGTVYFDGFVSRRTTFIGP